MTAKSTFCACLIAVFGAIGPLSLAMPAQAEGYLQPFIDGRNNLHRNITGDDLADFATTLRESKRIVIDIEVENIPQCTAHAPRCLKFHLISAPNPDNRGWDLIGGVSKETFDNRWSSNRARKYRPTDVESVQKHVVNADGRGGVIKVYYAGLWVENREKLAWASFTEIEREKFNKEFRERVRDGSMVLVDLERTGFNGRKVAAIFVRPRAEHRNSRWQPSKSEFERDAPRIFTPGGGWPLYMRPEPEFDMSLRQDGVRHARVFTALNGNQLKNRLASARSDGFQLVDVERNGDKWLAIFLRRRRE